MNAGHNQPSRSIPNNSTNARQGVPRGARQEKTFATSTMKRARQNPANPLPATVYIDIEEDLTLESVIFSSEYNGSAPPAQQREQVQPFGASSDEDNSLNNSLIRELDYDSFAEDGESCDDEDPQNFASRRRFPRQHPRQSTVALCSSHRSKMLGPRPPSDIDLRASFSTLLHGNSHRKGATDRVEHKSSSVRLNTVCLVPESEMDQRRTGSSKTDRTATSPSEEHLISSHQTFIVQSVSSSSATRSPRSSRSSSTSTSNPSTPHNRRRRKNSRPGYNNSSGSGPFGQVDLSTVSLAAAGISLVAGLSFSAGYALGRRSEVHLAVAS